MSPRFAAGASQAIAALEERLFPVLRRFADEPHLAAIRDAVQLAFYAFGVWTVIAFFLLPPGPLLERFFSAYHIGFGFMGIALAAVLPDRLACRFGYSRIAGIALGLSAFLFSLPPNALHQPFESFLGQISASSLFLALIVGVATSECLRLAHQHIRNEMAALAVGIAAGIAIFGGLTLAHVDIGRLLIALIAPLISLGDTLPALLIVVFLQTLLWSAGIHGPAFLAALTTPVYLRALDENAQALLHHQTPPHIVTIMIFLFIYPGGSGATLPLAFLCLRTRVARLRRLGVASLLPSIANVNEPLIFGVPIVMNPGLVLPFIGIPLVLATLTYTTAWFGLVRHTTVWLPGAIPSLIGAWLTTKGDWRALVLMCVNVGLAFALWTPFFRAFERTVQAQPDAEEGLVKAAEAIREHEQAEHRLAMTAPKK